MATSPYSLSPIIAAIFICSSLPSMLSAQGGQQWGIHRESERLLRSFTKGNATFECSPSGPCVACQFSEKNDPKYRCSETGYRIPLKCVEIEDGLKEANSNKVQKIRFALEADPTSNSYVHPYVDKVLHDAKKLTTSARYPKWRRLLDPSSNVEAGKQNYVTYRSCVPAVDEEFLTFLGFEGIMVCLLLVSGPVVYVRKKRTATMSGVQGRSQEFITVGSPLRRFVQSPFTYIGIFSRQWGQEFITVGSPLRRFVQSPFMCIYIGIFSRLWGRPTPLDPPSLRLCWSWSSENSYEL